MMAETIIPYSFYGANEQAFYCREPEVMLAGPADTGKTLALLTKLHLLALMYRGASIVICRKQQTDIYSTVLQTYQKEVAQDEIASGVVVVKGGVRPWMFEYPDGAIIWVAGLDKPGKTLSGQHDIIYVNQAEELALADWEVLNRATTGRAGHIPYNQTIGDCNPGPPTHWIIQRSRMGPLKRFDSTHRDNPQLYDPATGMITEEGMRRIGGLERLSGVRYERLYQGVWAAPEGAIYEVFDEEHHKVASFAPPIAWPVVVGVDPIGAYVAAVWCAWDQQNRTLNVYREYCEPFGVPTRDHAANVLRAGYAQNIVSYVVGAKSERQARADWEAAGVPGVDPPYADVWAGIDKVNELLTDYALVVHESCVGLLSEIGDYRRKLGKDGLPTEQIENKDQYHLLDALRYAVAWLTEPATQAVTYDPVRIGRW